MKEYKVTLKEVLFTECFVKAKDEEEAKQKALIGEGESYEDLDNFGNSQTVHDIDEVE
jgi:hypothetical protein